MAKIELLRHGLTMAKIRLLKCYYYLGEMMGFKFIQEAYERVWFETFVQKMYKETPHGARHTFR